MRTKTIAIMITTLAVAVAIVVSTHQAPKCNVEIPTVSAVIEQVNAQRVIAGLPALVENKKLNSAAQAKADDEAKRKYFSHTDPDGRTAWHLIDEAGYKRKYSGENLAIDFPNTKDTVAAWVASPTHYGNIIKPQYQDTGVGIAVDGCRVYAVQFFGSK